jgi:hypothetical protein
MCGFQIAPELAAARNASHNSNRTGKIMRRTLLGTTAAIMLLASPAYAWESIAVVLLQGMVWNGNGSMSTEQFSNMAACEAAAGDFEAKGRAAIAAARPGLTAEGIKSAFWHSCKPVAK